MLKRKFLRLAQPLFDRASVVHASINFLCTELTFSRAASSRQASTCTDCFIYCNKWISVLRYWSSSVGKVLVEASCMSVAHVFGNVTTDDSFQTIYFTVCCVEYSIHKYARVSGRTRTQTRSILGFVCARFAHRFHQFVCRSLATTSTQPYTLADIV